MRTSYTGGSANFNINGAIIDGGASNVANYYKWGLGTVTLGGAAANTFTGSTSIENGMLVLDYTGANVSKLSDTGALKTGCKRNPGP